MPYSHVARAVFGRPWAVLPETMAAIAEVIDRRLLGEPLTIAEIDARLEAASRDAGPRAGARTSGDIAVIPIYGVLLQRASLMSAMSGATSVQSITAAFRSALDDETVSAIVLDIDSPGGEVSGIPELAAEIRAARGVKPIVAVADTLAASAAYWLAAQADEIVAMPSAIVGSIGVLWAHTDESVAEEQQGLRTEIVSAGRYKAEITPLSGLSDEARSFMQSQVDATYAMFVKAVADGRGAKAADVRSGYGEGRALVAKDALAAGLVDRIGTLQETIERVAAGRVKPRGLAAMILEQVPEPQVAADDAERLRTEVEVRRHRALVPRS